MINMAVTYKLKFYNAENATMAPKFRLYPNIDNPRELYWALCHCWSRETCAPRLRDQWSEEENITIGQCSITAFLVQDIFGGEVYGIPMDDGGYHCYNVVDGVIFDLTSEQFKGEKELNYDKKNPQDRYEHFKDYTKFERYLLLTQALMNYLLLKK